MRRRPLDVPPWALVALAAALTVPIIATAAMAGAGPAILVTGAVLGVVVVAAILARPRGPIEIAAASEGAPPATLVVALAAPDDPEQLREAVTQEAERRVCVVAPALIDTLDRWASDVEGARRRARDRLAATTRALGEGHAARAGAQVGASGPVQAVEDALRSLPAERVVVIFNPRRDDSDAIAELRARLPIPVQTLPGRPAPAGIST